MIPGNTFSLPPEVAEATLLLLILVLVLLFPEKWRLTKEEIIEDFPTPTSPSNKIRIEERLLRTVLVLLFCRVRRNNDGSDEGLSAEDSPSPEREEGGEFILVIFLCAVRQWRRMARFS